MFRALQETEQSKIFPNEAFGYWKITVERPLRLATDFSPLRLKRFKKACQTAKEEPLTNLVQRVADQMGPGPHLDFDRVMDACEKDADRHGVNLTAKRLKLFQSELTYADPAAAPVIRKISKPGRVAADPLYGRYEGEINGKLRVAEYEPDSSLRDTEQVPLLEPGGIEAFFWREVQPHVPDAWIDPDKTQIGYEISFTRYFYKPQALRTLAEIRADLEALQAEGEGLLERIVGSARA